MSSRLTVSGSAIWPIAYLAAPVPYRGCSLGGYRLQRYRLRVTGSWAEGQGCGLEGIGSEYGLKGYIGSRGIGSG